MPLFTQSTGPTTIHEFIKAEDWPNVLRLACNPQKLQERDIFRQTVLHAVLRRGAPTPVVLELLLKLPYKALITVNDQDETPLHIAASFGASIATILVLLKMAPQATEMLTIMSKKPADMVAVWSFYPDDKDQARQALRSPAVAMALWQAIQANDHRPTLETMAKRKKLEESSVWQPVSQGEVDEEEEHHAEVQRLLKLVDARQVIYTAIPVDPNVRAMVEARDGD